MSFAAQIIQRWKNLARPRPLVGRLEGRVEDIVGTDKVVFLMIDGTGRVMQGRGGSISGMVFSPILKPRKSIAKLFDDFGVEDWDNLEVGP